MEIKRIETFALNKRSFIYYDLSRIRSNGELSAFCQSAKEFIGSYKPASVYAIANVEGISFDSHTKTIALDFIEFNAPFVVHAAIINIDGMRKLLFNTILAQTTRENIKYFNSRQEAVTFLSNLSKI